MVSMRVLLVVGHGEIETLECLDCGVSIEGYNLCPACREYRRYLNQGGGIIIPAEKV